MFFKSNQLILLLLLTITSFTFSAQATADQCANVEFNSFKYSGKNYIFEVVGHNNKDINELSSFKQIMNGNQQYTLSPGLHHFQINLWQKRSFKTSILSKRRELQITPITRLSKIVPPKIKHIQLYVNANTHYKVSILDNTKEPQFTLSSEEKKCLVAENQPLLSAEPVSKFSKDKKIPENLEYRLRRIINDIVAQKGDVINNVAVFSPVKFNSYFGAAIDKAYANNGKALKVLAVSPYSFAANIGLKSDDNITKLGINNIVRNEGATIEQLNNYLNSLTLGDNIMLEVNRNKKKVQLQKPYYPTVIPEGNYQISDSSIAPQQQPTLRSELILPQNLQTNFDQLLLELADYYQSINVTDQQIELSRSANYDHVYGLLGKVIPQEKNNGIQVTYVSDGSPAHTIGLKGEDTIIAINNQPLIEKSALPFIKTISQLKNNENYSITVKRKEKIRTLTGKYKPVLFNAFKFSINLNSINLANKQFEEYARAPKKGSNKHVGLFRLSDKQRGYSCQSGVWGNICDGTGINDYTNVSANKLKKNTYYKNEGGSSKNKGSN